MLNFPDSPAPGDVFGDWRWDGTRWIANTPTFTPGNVSNVGTPVLDQWAQWSDATHIKGVDAAAAPWLLRSGGQSITGDTTWNSYAPSLNFFSSQGAYPQFVSYAGGTGYIRWVIKFGDNNPEVGGGYGTDYVIARYDDNNAKVDDPLMLERGTGLAYVNQLVLKRGDPTAALQAATKQYVDSKVGGGAAKSGFRAKAITTQTAPYSAKVIFQQTIFNTGNHFISAAGQWTPPAGPVIVGANLLLAGLTLNQSYSLQILRQGTATIVCENSMQFAQTNGTISICAVDYANGTDHYEVWLFVAGSGTQILGASANAYTYFYGHSL